MSGIFRGVFFLTCFRPILTFFCLFFVRKSVTHVSVTPVTAKRLPQVGYRRVPLPGYRKVGYSGKLRWDTTRPNGQPRRMLDVSRARERFGFEAQTNFSDGLDETIAWYRKQDIG